MSKQTYDYFIVGAGFAGSILAERLSNLGNKKILLIDKRSHIGGNAFDCYDANGILIHKYGPHIFHTNSKYIFDYLSQFTEWRFYEHRVKASIKEMHLPFPININTINNLYNLNFSRPEELESFLATKAEKRNKIISIEDYIVSKLGYELYELFFKNYSFKQWGTDGSNIDASVAARIPLRNNFDDRYFTDRYQFMPLHGYTQLFERLLANPGIEILLNTNYEDVKGDVDFKIMIFTGSIDSYFGFNFGKLMYRSLYFACQSFEQEYIQDVAVINYPNSFDYTRTTEFKYLTGQTHPFTTVMYEFPTSDGDPYYPVKNKESRSLYNQYIKNSRSIKNVYFAGRLGTYQYLNMDQVIAQSLKVFDRLKKTIDEDFK